MPTAAPFIDRRPSTRPWYAQAWPWLIMLGPACVVVAGSYTCYLAYARQDAMVVDDYYKQGQAINQDLRRDRAATALGLSMRLGYDAAAGRLAGTVLAKDRPLAGRVHIHLAHSTLPEKDVQLEAPLDVQGRFSVALPMLERARWQVRIEGERRDWRLNGVWDWPHQTAIALAADAPPAE